MTTVFKNEGKFCRDCKRWLNFRDFYKTSKRISTYCRECTTRRAREQYRLKQVANGQLVRPRERDQSGFDPEHASYYKLKVKPPHGYAQCTHPMCRRYFKMDPFHFPAAEWGMCHLCSAELILHPTLHPFQTIPAKVTEGLCATIPGMEQKEKKKVGRPSQTTMEDPMDGVPEGPAKDAMRWGLAEQYSDDPLEFSHLKHYWEWAQEQIRLGIPPMTEEDRIKILTEE